MAKGPVMGVAEVEAYLGEVFPQLLADGRVYTIEAVGPMTARMRMRAGERHLRPGGTVSGPAMMGLCDLALYVAILAQIGPVGLAVTTSLGFNFLRKPGPGDLLAECRLMKLGKRLAVGEASLFAEGADEVVCHATGTYSIPPR
ncbi:PaaI family thioesterase [Enterovirga sp.]|uniref:PaaI family thioesterase n=1 Tax=Enterovirga sp. TaxID=2026350 RepID=UPI002C4737EF|nr:PaaI family thioesterase [Enterovirga sp.]HMO28681.1 PaaI family thioesterase [Enterovirga sp.]